MSCKGVAVHGKNIFLCVYESLTVNGVQVVTLTGDDVSFIPHLGPGSFRHLCLNSDGN